MGKTKHDIELGDFQTRERAVELKSQRFDRTEACEAFILKKFKSWGIRHSCRGRSRFSWDEWQSRHCHLREQFQDVERWGVGLVKWRDRVENSGIVFIQRSDFPGERCHKLSLKTRKDHSIELFQTASRWYESDLPDEGPIRPDHLRADPLWKDFFELNFDAIKNLSEAHWVPDWLPFPSMSGIPQSRDGVPPEVHGNEDLLTPNERLEDWSIQKIGRWRAV